MSTSPTRQLPRIQTSQATAPARPVEPVPLGWVKPRRRWVVPVVVVIGLASLGFGLREVVNDATKADESLVYYTVRRGTLPIVVTERGNLESQQTEQVICEVENFGGDRSGNTGTQILFIVPNGSSVKEGDLLVELDSAPLTERLDTQFLSLRRAEAEKIQANSRYENQQTQNETNLAEAELRVKLAKLEMESYEDEAGGTFQIELQNIEMEIQKARAEQMIRKSDLEAVEILYGLGYKSKGEKAAAELDLLRADANLASQMSQIHQLRAYTYTMEKLDRKGKFDTAEQNLQQVKLNNEAELAQAEAAKESADQAYEKERERYERYKEQLEKCKIYAPQGGMVAYAMGEGRYNRGGVIEEGAFVRQRQEILSLPDLSKMQVNTAVHESVLDQVKPELSAVIRVDAFPDRSYMGKVKTVAVLPDQGGWMASDTKVYKTIVTIDEEVSQLKPGMTAVVEIDIEKLTDVLSVPIQAIVQRGSKSWCYVHVKGGLERRELSLGKTNDKFVEIKQGLQTGDSVVLNPMSLVEEQEQAEKAKRAKQNEEAEEPTEPEEDVGVPPAPDITPPGEQGEQSARDAEVERESLPARPQPAEGDTNGGGRGKAGGGPPGKRPDRGGRGGFNMMQFDKNGDGKLTKDELPERMQPMFDGLDKNQDGALEASEMARPGRKDRPD